MLVCQITQHGDCAVVPAVEQINMRLEHADVRTDLHTGIIFTIHRQIVHSECSIQGGVFEPAQLVNAPIWHATCKSCRHADETFLQL